MRRCKVCGVLERDVVSGVWECDGVCYCLLHLPVKKRQVKLFKNELIHRITKSILGDKCVLNDIHFPPIKNLSNVFGLFTGIGFCFKRCNFYDGIDLEDVCIDIEFSHCTFGGAVDFQRVYSDRCITFNSCVLSDFFISCSEFHDKICFVSSKVSGAIYIKESYFYKFDFLFASVFNFACYDSTFFDLTFFLSDINGGFDVDGCDSYKLKLWNSKFAGVSNVFDSCFFYLYFEGAYFDKKILFRSIDLSGLDFDSAPVEQMSFVGCIWPKVKGRKGWGGEEWLGRGEGVEQTLRRLKQVARRDGDEVSASDFHYNEKEAQVCRLAKDIAGSALLDESVFVWWRTFFLLSVLRVYRTISGYGEEPSRAFIWLVLFVLLPFVLVGLLSPGLELGDVLTRGAWYLPLSGVDLGGGVKVSGWQTVGRVLVSVLVSAQAALFGFALRNKLRR